MNFSWIPKTKIFNFALKQDPLLRMKKYLMDNNHLLDISLKIQ